MKRDHGFGTLQFETRNETFLIMLTEYFLIALCALGQFGAKADLGIRIESVELGYVDSEYFDTANTNLYLEVKEDDSSDIQNPLNSKVAIVQQLPNSTNAHLVISALVDGEYNRPTGVNITMKICELLMERVVIGPLLLAMGFSDQQCPPGPGTYVQQGYTLRNITVPKFVPPNKYLSSFEIVLEGIPILVTNAIVEVYVKP